MAFQGEFGAWSEWAVRRACGAAAEPLPCRTLREVFDAIEAGRADLGVVPVENSRAGSVVDTYDLLLQRTLAVRGEVAIPIEQCLLAPPGARLEAVRRVYSHPQALAQCEAYLRRLGAETIAVYDTAGSARSLGERPEEGAAAVASARAAGLYGLQVLARGIQDDPDNVTRFFVVGPSGPAVPGGPGRPRTLLALGLAEDDAPGALFWSLGTLAFWRLNLSRIESRPSRKRSWHYHFYLDVDADAGACAGAVSELRARGADVRVLGSFPSFEPAGPGDPPGAG